MDASDDFFGGDAFDELGDSIAAAINEEIAAAISNPDVLTEMQAYEGKVHTILQPNSADITQVQARAVAERLPAQQWEKVRRLPILQQSPRAVQPQLKVHLRQECVFQK